MKYVICLGVFLCLWCTGVSAEEFVYYIEQGTRYHHADCFFIKGKTSLKTTRNQAEILGLKVADHYEEVKSKKVTQDQKRVQ